MMRSKNLSSSRRRDDDVDVVVECEVLPDAHQQLVPVVGRRRLDLAVEDDEREARADKLLVHPVEVVRDGGCRRLAGAVADAELAGVVFVDLHIRFEAVRAVVHRVHGIRDRVRVVADDVEGPRSEARGAFTLCERRDCEAMSQSSSRPETLSPSVRGRMRGRR